MKRKWNQSADRLASTALQNENGRTVVAEEDRRDLITLNRLDELSKPKQDGQSRDQSRGYAVSPK